MRKFLILLLFLISCSQTAVQVDQPTGTLITDTSFQYINTDLNQDYENFTNKKTIIVFWADYWSACRRELPALEKELDNLTENYDVLALAHSDYGPTLEWAEDNLNGKCIEVLEILDDGDMINILKGRKQIKLN